MYIFFDVETTGLPKYSKAPVTDFRSWPRAVQIAWARYDARDRHLITKSFIVKPEGFSIPREAERIHGISTAKALAHGKPLITVLNALAADFEEAKIVVAHNLESSMRTSLALSSCARVSRFPFLIRSKSAR